MTPKVQKEIDGFLEKLSKCKGEFIITDEGLIRSYKGCDAHQSLSAYILPRRACPLEWVDRSPDDEIRLYDDAAKHMGLSMTACDLITDAADGEVLNTHAEWSDDVANLRAKMLDLLGLTETAGAK